VSSFIHRELATINRELFIRAPWHVRLRRWARDTSVNEPLIAFLAFVPLALVVWAIRVLLMGLPADGAFLGLQLILLAIQIAAIVYAHRRGWQ
jgi:hypothetical protein